MPSRSRARQTAQPSTGADPQPVPVTLGGSFMAGDTSAIPDGYVRLMQNMLPRPGRFDSRPPFVYDGLMGIVSFARWEDLKNQQTRLVGMDSSKKFYLKAASGETWGATIGSASTGTRITSFTNYRGKLFMMLDDGAGNPVECVMWDGTNLVSGPFNSPIVARTVTSYGDRLFFTYPRHVIAVLSSTPLTYCYDWTNTPFQKSNVTANIVVTNTGASVCRLSPTSTAAKACYVVAQPAASISVGIINVAANASSVPYTWHSDLRGNDALYRVPFTIEWVMVQKLRDSLDSTALGVGYMLTATAADGNDYIYQNSTNGTTGVGAPVWPTAQGASVADGGVTWVNIGSAILAAVEAYVPNASEQPQFSTFFVTGTVPPRINVVNITPRLKLWNSQSTALTTLASIDISLKDGKTDGDPAKANHGQQWTQGDIQFPFFNQESSATATVNLETIMWSESGDYKTIRAANTFEPKEAAGLMTAANLLSGRFMSYKRRAFWTFKLTNDPDNPILPESPARVGVGCLGPLAMADFEDELFWIAENEIYRMRIGGDPQALCHDAMREEVMSRGANWVESQATYNEPLLAIDPDNHEIWVYTQKGKLYCCHIPASGPSLSADLFTAAPLGTWTVHTTPNGAEVSALAFNPTTHKMYAAFGGFGLCRLDSSVTAQDQVDNTANFYPVSKDIVFKPFELFAPRYELALHEIHLYHLATASQAGQQLWVYVSRDRGATYPYSVEVQFDPTVTPVPLSPFEFGPSLTVKASHVGQAGAAAWAISKADAYVELLAGEWPYAQPTQLGATL